MQKYVHCNTLRGLHGPYMYHDQQTLTVTTVVNVLSDTSLAYGSHRA
jgi:hypothetical protein